MTGIYQKTSSDYKDLDFPANLQIWMEETFKKQLRSRDKNIK